MCVAGGVGLAPFLLLAQERRALARSPLRLLFGGRDRASLAGMEDFEDLARLWTSTDDGSHGYHGLVTDLLDDVEIHHFLGDLCRYRCRQGGDGQQGRHRTIHTHGILSAFLVKPLVGCGTIYAG